MIDCRTLSTCSFCRQYDGSGKKEKWSEILLQTHRQRETEREREKRKCITNKLSTLQMLQKNLVLAYLLLSLLS